MKTEVSIVMTRGLMPSYLHGPFEIEQSHQPRGHARSADKARGTIGRPVGGRRFDLCRSDRVYVGDRIDHQSYRIGEAAQRDEKW